MQRVNTSEHKASQRYAHQITLPNGKYLYTGVNSMVTRVAEGRSLDCRIVEYSGNCMGMHINEQAHSGSPIQIDGVSVADFLDKIATHEECLAFSQP